MGKGKILLMGSCRVVEPFKDDKDSILYPGGHVHSTTCFLQALRIMRGEIEVPKELEKFAFRGWGSKAESKLVDLDSVSSVVMEICSFKYLKYGKLILNHAYSSPHERQGLDEKKLKVHYETPDDIRKNLSKLKEQLEGKRILFVLNNNITSVVSRYRMGYIVSDWCSKNSIEYIDPISIIAFYGIKKCFPKSDPHFKRFLFEGATYDPYHYTDFMKKKFYNYIKKVLESKK